jgi:hypothetical protein
MTDDRYEVFRVIQRGCRFLWHPLAEKLSKMEINTEFSSTCVDTLSKLQEVYTEACKIDKSCDEPNELERVMWHAQITWILNAARGLHVNNGHSDSLLWGMQRLVTKEELSKKGIASKYLDVSKAIANIQMGTQDLAERRFAGVALARFFEVITDPSGFTMWLAATTSEVERQQFQGSLATWADAIAAADSLQEMIVEFIRQEIRHRSGLVG